MTTSNTALHIFASMLFIGLLSLWWQITDLNESIHPLSRSFEELNFCRVQQDQTFGYVCRGSEYEDFADKLHGLIEDDSFHQPKHWGKRSGPFPANSTLLAVGNSLTRQVFQALACQYQQSDSLVSWVDQESKSENFMNRGTFYKGTFKNGATLYLVTNHAMFYSPKWPEFLTNLIQVDQLESLDGLIIGHINHFMNAYNTSFMDLMMKEAKNWDGADFQAVSPPVLSDFAKHYHGPIVGVSMMADWSSYDQDYFDMLAQHAIIDRSNVRIVHGRKYISHVGECASNNWKDVGTCEERPDSHRCIGSRGGHPDLIAWDTLETVSDLLEYHK